MKSGRSPALKSRILGMVRDSFLNERVTVQVGDITQQEVDAIVNAANSSLLGGGGVDGAIHRVGGPAILRECEELRATKYPKGLPAGQAVTTSGGKLKARYVIHTVGPIYSHDPEPALLLASCYENSLKLASEKSLVSIAFPAISTGAYGYPREEAAVVCSTAIKGFIEQNDKPETIHLVFFSENNARVFSRYQKFE